MSDIKILRLVSGDDIIGEIIKTRFKKKILIKDPMRILAEYDPVKKTHHTFLIRWMPHANERVFEIQRSNLVTEPKPPILEIEDHYYDVIDETYEPENLDDLSFIARQIRRMELKIMLEVPPSKDKLN